MNKNILCKMLVFANSIAFLSLLFLKHHEFLIYFCHTAFIGCIFLLIYNMLYLCREHKKHVIAIAIAMFIEYMFIILFIDKNAFLYIPYILVSEVIRIAVWLQLMNPVEERWHLILAKRYFYLAIISLSMLILYIIINKISVTARANVFSPGLLVGVLAVVQLTAYHLLRPKCQPRVQKPQTKQEQIIAWLVYCISGYRKPMP